MIGKLEINSLKMHIKAHQDSQVIHMLGIFLWMLGVMELPWHILSCQKIQHLDFNVLVYNSLCVLHHQCHIIINSKPQHIGCDSLRLHFYHFVWPYMIVGILYTTSYWMLISNGFILEFIDQSIQSPIMNLFQKLVLLFHLKHTKIVIYIFMH
jgi:hypothetical protein